MVSIDGQLLAEYVPLAEDCCSQAIAAGKAVTLVLHDVSAIDEAGRSMLLRLAARGVRLCGSGIYTGHIIRTLQRRPEHHHGETAAPHDRHT